MRVVLQVPYADTAAAQLGFSLELDPQPALYTVDLADAAGPGTGVQLRLLGASHQVLLTAPTAAVTETVACLPGMAGGLPAHPIHRPVAGLGRYVFSARARRLSAAGFRAGVRRLRAWAAGPHAIVGEFPGDPDALTVIAARPGADRVGWWTVHCYPRTSDMVFTRTVVTPR
jgi:hypothetical protein